MNLTGTPEQIMKSMFDENDEFISKHEDPELYKEAVAAYDLLGWRLTRFSLQPVLEAQRVFLDCTRERETESGQLLKTDISPTLYFSVGTLSAPIGNWLSSMARTLLIICFEHSWPFWIVRIWAV